MDEITVHVTDEDIEEGEKGNAARCPIALAARREYMDYSRFFVSYSWMEIGVRFNYDDGIHIYTLPEGAKRFITAFDSGLPVAPFKFTAKLLMDDIHG